MSAPTAHERLVRRSAVRVLEALAAGVQNRQGGGWYFYLDRADVERLALAQVNDTERAVYREKTSIV